MPVTTAGPTTESMTSLDTGDTTGPILECPLPRFLGECIDNANTQPPFRCTLPLAPNNIVETCNGNVLPFANVFNWEPDATGTFVFSTLTTDLGDTTDTEIRLRQQDRAGGFIDKGCGSASSSIDTEWNELAVQAATLQTTETVEIVVGSDAQVDIELMIVPTEAIDPTCCAVADVVTCQTLEPLAACCACDFDVFCCDNWDERCADAATGICGQTCP